jgi:hypothetical protein
MRFRSCSCVLPVLQAPNRSIALARRDAAVPPSVRSNRRLVAGVRFPAASTRLGVDDGGPMELFRGVAPGVLPAISPALIRKLLDALFASLYDISSRFVGLAI